MNTTIEPKPPVKRVVFVDDSWYEVGKNGVRAIEWRQIYGPMYFLDTLAVIGEEGQVMSEWLFYQLRGVIYEGPDVTRHDS